MFGTRCGFAEELIGTWRSQDLDLQHQQSRPDLKSQSERDGSACWIATPVTFFHFVAASKPTLVVLNSEYFASACRSEAANYQVDF
jgi:hypothetical protein